MGSIVMVGSPGAHWEPGGPEHILHQGWSYGIIGLLSIQKWAGHHLLAIARLIGGKAVLHNYLYWFFVCGQDRDEH